jgi:hypothetical protein
MIYYTILHTIKSNKIRLKDYNKININIISAYFNALVVKECS